MPKSREKPELVNHKDQILKAFSIFAKKSGISINPVVRSLKERVLLERLYEEKLGDRVFQVGCVPEGHSYSIDGWIKRTGRDEELELLHVNIINNDNNIRQLWRIYQLWLHKRAGKEHVMRVLSGRKNLKIRGHNT